MNRIFGSGKDKTPAPDMNDVVANLDSRCDSVGKKIALLDKEIAKCKADMAKLKPNTPGYNNAKRRALNFLKQRKMYENNRDNIMNQQFNMEQANMALQTVKDTKDTVTAMKTNVKQFKKEYKKIDIDKIADLTDELDDMMDQAGEIQYELGRSIGGQELDEADLEAELDALGEDFGLSDSNYLDDAINAPGVPSALPGETVGPSSVPAGGGTVNGVQVDEFGLPQIPEKN